MIGVAHTLLGAVILVLVGVPDTATPTNSMLAIVSGVLMGAGGLTWILLAYRQEISRLIPVTQIAPIFSAILAVFFLSESMSAFQWVSVVATVTGAIAISVRVGERYRGMFIHPSFPILILGAFVSAAANVIGKSAVDDLPLLYTHGLRSLSLGLLFLVVGARKVPISNFTTLVRNRSPAFLFFGINEFIVANVGLIFLLSALSSGQASLVLAAAGTRALFVVLFSTLLALIWKGALGEETNRQAVVVKISGTTLIVAGIVGVSL